MFSLYLIRLCGAISTIASIIALFCSFFIAAYLFWNLLDNYDSGKNFKVEINPFIKRTSWILGICLLLIVLIPSKKECYAIFGLGTVVNYVSNNKQLQEIPDVAVDALYKYLNGTSNNQESK